MPTPQPASYNPNSLWRNGSRAFFKDQRAHQVGDILTVKVKITDKAKIENETAAQPHSATRMRRRQISSAEQALPGLIKANVAEHADRRRIHRPRATARARSTARRRSNTNIAAVVTQVLPNGNLVIEGRQEVRVNFEVRELIVAGIVRPEDIESDNTIDSTKIAQARIAYGGRGQITDVQQPRYGQQVMDMLLPF